ncbi:MAG: tetratricopeptide repeat-containing sulfotransferase family protein [Caulobacteraceae bacterium]
MNDPVPGPADATPGLDSLIAALEHAARVQDLDAAFRLAGQAVAAGAAHPLAYRLHGADLERRGRSAEAAAALQHALRFAPDDAPTLNALGFSQTKLGQLAQATATLGRAAGLAPGFAPIHFNLGHALEQQGRLAAAEAAYAEAVRLDPHHVAAMAALAVLHARKSRWAQARTQAEAALAKAPGLPAAHLALAMADLGTRQLQAAEDRLTGLIAAPGLPPHERAVAFNLLAETLDRRGDATAAYSAYSVANAGFRQLFGPAGAQPTGRTLARQLQTQLDDRRLDLPRAAPVDRSPVFLLSFPRSATTLTGQILAAHPGVVVSDEQELLADAARAYLVPADGLSRLAAADAAQLERDRQAYWRALEATGLDVAGRLFVDKLPMNTLALPVIARLFPGAKVIFMVRDPRDVVWSCFRQRFIGSGVAREFTDLEQTAELYDAVMTLADTCLERLDLQVRFQSYERLVSAFDEQVAELCGFLGLAPNAAMADFAGGVNVRDIATPSAVQIARGLNGDSIGQWRRHGEPMATAATRLAPWIARFGYPAD